MKIKVNGIALSYEKMGQGTPLILLHGNGEDHRIFLPLIKKLKAHYTVYAIDSRNHGESDASNDYSYQAMTADIAAFIETLGLTDARIVGFSDGGIICLLLGIHYNLPISKMAILGANLSPADFSDESLAHIKVLYQQAPSPLVKLMLDEPNISVASLANIHIPTFVIAAENDIYKPEAFARIHTNLPQSKAKIIAGHDHGSYIIDNDFLATDLLGFFK